jgi:hypothetical protein
LNTVSLNDRAYKAVFRWRERLPARRFDPLFSAIFFVLDVATIAGSVARNLGKPRLTDEVRKGSDAAGQRGFVAS